MTHKLTCYFVDDNGKEIATALLEPECGRDFCDTCGDCLHCDYCPCGYWVSYAGTEDDAERRQEAIEDGTWEPCDE